MSSRKTRIEIQPKFSLKLDIKGSWKSESVGCRSNAFFWSNSP